MQILAVYCVIIIFIIVIIFIYFFTQAGLILELTCGDPVSRPTARQVVDRLAQHSMDNDVDSNNNTHQRTIGQLQDTIDQLRRQLMEKDAKIEQLTRMVNGL